MKADKARDARGPPFANDDNFEQVKGNYHNFLRKWGRFGLSKACDECGTLTPGRYCLQSKRTEKMACKNCREKRTKYVLPTLPPTPATLAALNALGRRLLAMAKVNQVLIDKLPAGGPSAQWGRMYMSPLDEPRLCNLLEGAELGQDGEVYGTNEKAIVRQRHRPLEGPASSRACQPARGIHAPGVHCSAGFAGHPAVPLCEAGRGDGYVRAARQTPILLDPDLPRQAAQHPGSGNYRQAHPPAKPRNRRGGRRHPLRLPAGREPQVGRHDSDPALQFHAGGGGKAIHAWFAAASSLAGR